MKVTIDKSACIGCAACEALCPEVFRLGADGCSQVIADKVTEGLQGEVIEAANACPAAAILVED